MKAEPEEVREIETPAVLVDQARLSHNIARVQAIASRNGLHLRPHGKTHKCAEIAQQQLAAGAIGITASKPDEAIAFIESGVKAVTIAYPIVDGRKLDRFLCVAGQVAADARFVIDSMEGFQLLATAAGNARRRPGILIEIDVGLHRCGLSPTDRLLPDLARQIHEDPHLRFIGLLSHAGHAYGAADKTEVHAIAATEIRLLRLARERIEEAGVSVAEVSVGSTPTVLGSGCFEGITDIRPGNYVFLDRTPVRLGLASIDDVALTVLTTVVSRNERYLIVDAGSKILSSDTGGHGTSLMPGFGAAYPIGEVSAAREPLIIEKLSEEHGFIPRAAGGDLLIGSRLQVVPNHSCPVANLALEICVVADGAVRDRWRPIGRGKVR